MSHVFFVATIGGSPEPLIKSLQFWSPEKICFIASEETRKDTLDVITQYNQSSPKPISEGAWDCVIVPDHQLLQPIIKTIRPLSRRIREWKERGENFKVVADFTGGTKCMSAGLALVARRWPTEFSYVGGTKRNKDDRGAVLSGSEVISPCMNPWEALGFQAAEDAVTAFNHGSYPAAAEQLAASMRSMEAGSDKRALAALSETIKAYAEWDRFQHKKAAEHFLTALTARNDLAAVFTDPADLIREMEKHQDLCTTLTVRNRMSWLLVDDLIANATRRARDQRFDDAVARLYRACESIAQVQLHERWQIEDTGRIPLEKLPPSLQSAWNPRARNGCVQIGLQDAFRLLASLGDELGTRFIEQKLTGQNSCLEERNKSILAHGFDPVSKKGYDQLAKAVHALRGIPQPEFGHWLLPPVQ